MSKTCLHYLENLRLEIYNYTFLMKLGILQFKDHAVATLTVLNDTTLKC